MKSKRKIHLQVIFILCCLTPLIMAFGLETPDTGYERIAVFGPNLVEIVFSLDRGNAVVAVDSYTSYPDEVKSLPRCGTLSHPNLEILIRQQPDLVMIQGDNQLLREFCRKQKIEYAVFRLEGVSGILDGIQDIARLLGKEESGRKLVKKMENELTHNVSADSSRPGVLLSLGGLHSDLNITTAGGRTFLSELLGLAGGNNIFKDLRSAYPDVSMEEVLVRNPEIIFELVPGKQPCEAQVQRRKEFWSRFPSIQAVQNDQVFYLTEDYLLIPGPRITEILQIFLRYIQKN